MKKSKIVYLIGGFVAISIIVSFTTFHGKNTQPPIIIGQNYVPDSTTAIKIAEVIWFPLYGEKINKHKPFRAKLVGDTLWLVKGTVHTNVGGGPIIKIMKRDCRIIYVYHEK